MSDTSGIREKESIEIGLTKTAKATEDIYSLVHDWQNKLTQSDIKDLEEGLQLIIEKAVCVICGRESSETDLQKLFERKSTDGKSIGICKKCFFYCDEF